MVLAKYRCFICALGGFTEIRN